MTDPGPPYNHFTDFGYACTKYLAVVGMYLVHAPNTSPLPVGHREVLSSSLLLVSDWSPMVFSGLRSVFYGPRLPYDGFQYTSQDTGGKTGP